MINCWNIRLIHISKYYQRQRIKNPSYRNIRSVKREIPPVDEIIVLRIQFAEAKTDNGKNYVDTDEEADETCES